MKRRVYTSVAIMILASVLGVSANAQTSGQQKLSASIPFAFTAGQTSLPAGEYTVTVANPSSDRKVLQIRSADGSSSVMLQTISVIGKTHDLARLIFHRYGDQYFFAQAWMAADETGVAAPRSSAEREHRRELARAGKKNDLVAVKGR